MWERPRYKDSRARSSATFAQFHMALGKQIIVYDPDKLTRSNRRGNAVHRAFNHLTGVAMVHSPAVLWLTEALEAIASHAAFSIPVGPDAAAS